MKKINEKNIRNKKSIIKQISAQILVILILMISITLVSPVISAADLSFCCEKTINGAWCQDAPRDQCDVSINPDTNTPFKSAPTSCESTSYCKRGCCYDSTEGECSESSPKVTCNDAGGTWSEGRECQIPQCNLGCCLLGDQAALLTLTKCKSLSALYSFETDFRAGIVDELTCIATANAKDKGACVYADSETAERTCKFTTREECSNEFYKDVLCSAEELGTICGPSPETIMVEGRDEIYYRDTCLNPANIYDSTKKDDNAYWTNIVPKSESCGAGQSNAGNKECGNCDYFLGSIGKEKSGIFNNPTYGDYICVDLNCDNGRRHGESWCGSDGNLGDGQDKVGSLFYKTICFNGEILTEPCADFRNEICIEDDSGGFVEAACRVNRWADCINQEEEEDCINTDLRDCNWNANYYFPGTGGLHPVEDKDANYGFGICLPKNSPGFNFWGESSTVTSNSQPNTATGFNAQTPGFGTGAVATPSSPALLTASCSMIDTGMSVTFEGKYEDAWSVVEDIFGDEPLEWRCTGNEKLCELTGDYPYSVSADDFNQWAQDMEDICVNLGDCGGHVNFIGAGTEDGFSAYYQSERFAGSGGKQKLEATPATGQAIADLFRGMFEGEGVE